ncbi:MAG: alanyl-tRNA editing protein [Gammaproteobacteria bacterium]|nr:alanyl-tRNA editing protein [Gammaproteobacteria bacterium]
MTEELFREDGYLRECEAEVTATSEQGVCLDRTVFYPMGGGQPGDVGKLVRSDGSEILVADTQKDRDSGDIVHITGEQAVLPEVGETVTAVIDWDRRHRLMRMHSCMHLLCAVIPYGVTGGQITDGRGRLDFDMQETLDKDQVTAELNRLISENHSMRMRWIADEELDAQPDLVRTMSVKPPRGAGRVRLVEFDQVDLQPCGGTHIASTGEIGPVRVAKIEKKGKHNRRVAVVFDGE